jgi:predicted Zn-dependent protease
MLPCLSLLFVPRIGAGSKIAFSTPEVRLNVLRLRTASLFALAVGVAGVPIALGQGATPAATTKPAAGAAGVRAWEGHLDLPTYEEGLPDVNPPFDAFETQRFNYPYTLRHNLTDRRALTRWRTLNLENEYLKVVVLPDLGGHLYSCVDKATGADMFYANGAIKKARISYRGAWTALGIEFNFPVSHNWVTASPVDYALRTEPDGSAAIWVGNQDRVYGMQWRVALRLRPGQARLQQDVALYNRSDTRHRFYWWSNAGVRVWDDSRIEYPMRFTASHGFREVDTWPVNKAGVDLTVVGNHTFGPVSQFSHGSREPFMGVYHPRTRAGVVHYSSPLDSPTKKFWSWGSDPDGLDWRKALSDDESAYVEVQSGLFRNQETYAFLDPQEGIRFTEYWMPVREIGGITRANPEATLHLTRAVRSGAVDLGIALNVTSAVRGGTVVVKDGARVVRSEPLAITPAGAVQRTFSGLPPAPRYTVEVRDGGGRVLLAHTEDEFDMLPASEIRLGPQPVRELPPPDRRTEGDILEVGADQELNGKRLAAWDTYAEGRKRFPESLGLLKAAGRLAVDLARYPEAAELLEKALARDTTDPEVQYYLGLAHDGLGAEGKARGEWEAAHHFRAFRTPALLKLAQADARAGEVASALARLDEATAIAPDAVRAGALEVALLRRAGRMAEASRRLRQWQALDPTSSLLRYEAVRLGSPDPALWSHLGADPDRVLDLASEYLAAGLYADALDLLDRRYPAASGLLTEPGAVAPQDHPEIVYYRGYAREKQGGSGAADYAAASKLSARYVFPSRAQSLVVLQHALAANPQDATAHFLLGTRLLASGRAGDAVREWQEARRLDKTMPVLHRNLGRTLLQVQGDVEGALAAFMEGMSADPTNVDLYQGADQALSLLGRPGAERIAALSRYPDRAQMPGDLLQRLALALAEEGRAEEAKALLAGRFFAREEGGTNIRQVFVEIRLLEALALARAGRHADALAIVDRLGREVPGFAFTKDGMDVFVDAPHVQYAAGEIAALAGDTAAARGHWQKATEGREQFFRAVPYAYLAAQRLGGANEAAGRARLESSLAQSEKVLEGGTGFPGPAVVSQGLILRALGREEEARARFRRALLLPDQRLSHLVSRRALQDARPF